MLCYLPLLPTFCVIIKLLVRRTPMGVLKYQMRINRGNRFAVSGLWEDLMRVVYSLKTPCKLEFLRSANNPPSPLA